MLPYLHEGPILVQRRLGKLIFQDSCIAMTLVSFVHQHVLTLCRTLRFLMCTAHTSDVVQPHSYGEYIFDHSWASLAMRFGHRYCESYYLFSKLRRLLYEQIASPLSQRGVLI